jgi:hypothetical protein
MIMLARLLDTAYGNAPIVPGHLQRDVARSGGRATHVFDGIAQAEQAIGGLAGAGIDTKMMSLVVRVSGSEDRAMGFHSAGDRLKSCDGAGAFWGGFWKLLRTPAVFVHPAVGLIAVAGPLVAALISELERGALVDGTSALGEAWLQLGVSGEQAIDCEKALSADRVVLHVHRSPRDMQQACAVLSPPRGTMASE